VWVAKVGKQICGHPKDFEEAKAMLMEFVNNDKNLRDRYNPD